MRGRFLIGLMLFSLVGCGDDDRRPMRDAAIPDTLGTDTSIDTGGAGCTPGAWSCLGNIYYLCGADGMSREMEMTCEGSCDPTMGCVACSPGERRCEGTVSMVCAPDASGFVTARDCAENSAACGAGGFCEDACGAAESSRSNVGCEYWAAPLPNFDFGTRYDFRIVVANPGDVAANVRVFRGESQVASAVVNPNDLSEIVLPWITGLTDAISTEPWNSFVTTNGAYRVLADRPVTVTQFNPFEYDNGMTDILGMPDYSFSNDASLLLPAHSFTGNYIGSSYSPLSIADPDLFGETYGKFPGWIAIVGVTPEPTQVSVSVSSATAGDTGGRIPALSRGGVASFALQRGEVAIIAAAAPPDCTTGRPGRTTDESGRFFCNEPEFDLTGSRVTANHPVAVFGGHTCAYVPYSAQACDHLEAQMPPLETWGTVFHSAPMFDPSGAERNIVRITGAFDGTSVTIDPPQSGTSNMTLNTGQWQEFETTSAFSVNATQGVMVTQYLLGQLETDADRGDPSMVVLPPSEQYRRDYTFVAPSSYNTGTDGQSYMLIVRPIGMDIQYDGSSISTSWTTVGDREVGTVPINGGTHRLVGADPFGAIIYGMGITTSYAYPAGLDLEEILLI